MNKTVLIVPMQPTPNGRMHIGHGSGTYLRADVLARALRVRGNTVHIISGSDAFENWILAASISSGMTPEDTCDYYHQAIQQDLKNLDIEFDTWIDPRSSEHVEKYTKVHENILTKLKETGGASLEEENAPYSAETKKAMMGTWISGKCPECGKPCGGSSCVYCSAHFQPEEIIDPRSRLDKSRLDWKLVESWFAHPTNKEAIIAYHQHAGLKPVWMEAVQNYLSKSGGRIRLSGPGNWGIVSNLVNDDFILANPYYLYSVYCGEVLKEIEGSSVNPFHPDSDVTTIGVFGSDNSTPGLVAPHVIAQGSEGTLKPFDITIVNGMLFLEGQKCSTSKSHGIWLNEIEESSTGITSDELRFFFTQVDLDNGNADISLNKLVESIKEFREWNEQKLVPAVATFHPTNVQINEYLQSMIDEQSKWISATHFNISSAVAVLKRWMYDDNLDQNQWLLGLALLGAPIIPKLAQKIWTIIGYKHSPNVDNLEKGVVSVHLKDELIWSEKQEISVDTLKSFVHLAEEIH